MRWIHSFIHFFTFGPRPTGVVVPQLSMANHTKMIRPDPKRAWLPGSPTRTALCTTVHVLNLSSTNNDSLFASHFFLFESQEEHVTAPNVLLMRRGLAYKPWSIAERQQNHDNKKTFWAILDKNRAVDDHALVWTLPSCTKAGNNPPTLPLPTLEPPTLTKRVTETLTFTH